MAKSRVFIASSTRTLVLAENLREQLATDFSSADVWSDASRSTASQTIIEILEKATEEYDFAVILLSKDDVAVTEGGETLKARDNCIFEAGLFMAAIGRGRCFLISSVLPKDLPTDLAGISLLPIIEPSDLQNHRECKDGILSASMLIKEAVQRIGPIENKQLSRDLLLERERKQSEGGELFEDQVVVASIQPLDVTYITATQLRKNIDGNIRYIFFIPANDECAQKICLLLQLVLLSGTLRNNDEADDFQFRRNKVKAEPVKMIDELEEICKDGSIKVFFLASPPELQYCIHNATDEMNAKQYVKHRDKFIQWASGKEAHQFWQGVKNLKPEVVDPKPPYAMFHGLPGVDVSEGPFFRTLEREVGRYFPGIENKVMELCLKGLRAAA